MSPAYFWLAALIHAGAVAARFDVLAMKLGARLGLAILVAQVPLVLLSGYFAAGARSPGELPRAAKAAVTLGLIYLLLVVAQTWDLEIGPLDPSPPASFPPAQRAVWFATFTLGMWFPFWLLAAKVFLPLLRALTWPMRQLPLAVGAVATLAVGAALGLAAFSAVTSTTLARFARDLRAAIEADPARMVAVILAATFVPLLVGVLASRRRRAPPPEYDRGRAR